MDYAIKKATDTIDDYVKNIKSTSRKIASELNYFIYGTAAGSREADFVVPYEVDIPSYFCDALLLIRSSYIESVSLLNKYELPIESREKICFMKYAYYRIKRLGNHCGILMFRFSNDPDHRDNIKNELRSIIRELRFLYI